MLARAGVSHMGFGTESASDEVLVLMNKKHQRIDEMFETARKSMRAGIRVIGLAAGMSSVTSCFLMVMPDARVFAYADCAVIPEPDAAQLSDITVATSRASLPASANSTPLRA